MKRVAAVKNEDTIDWNAEFGGDTEEFRFEDDEDEEIEIPLQRGKAGSPTTIHDTSSSSSTSATTTTQKIQPKVEIKPASTAMSLGSKARPESTTKKEHGPHSSSTYSDYPQTNMSATAPETRPSASLSFQPPMPRIELDPREHVVSPSPYTHYLELRTMSFSLKIICLIHVLMCMFYFLLPTFSWMIFQSFFFSAVGLWGAYRYKASFILIFLIGLGGNLGLLALFTFLELIWHHIQGPVVVLGFLFAIAELFMIQYSYQFWKQLPREEFQKSFSQFFSSHRPRLGGVVDEDEYL